MHCGTNKNKFTNGAGSSASLAILAIFTLLRTLAAITISCNDVANVPSIGSTRKLRRGALKCNILDTSTILDRQTDAAKFGCLNVDARFLAARLLVARLLWQADTSMFLDVKIASCGTVCTH